VAGRRLERVAEAIREVVSTAILFELKDPRVQGVTVLRVEVTGDLRNAKIFVSLMGDAGQQKLTMHGLNHARGFVQSKVAARLQTRWTPVIQFVVDESVKKSIEISRLIERAMASSPKTKPPDASAAQSTAEE
jgi:ribosome-binding factor A